MKDYKTAYMELIKEIKRERRLHKYQENASSQRRWYGAALASKESASALDAILVYAEQEKWKF